MKYVLAAETGLGFAQSNVAHLCEVNMLLLIFLVPLLDITMTRPLI